MTVVMRKSPESLARTRILYSFWSFILLHCPVADVAALDLSVPKDLVGQEQRLSIAGKGTQMGMGYLRPGDAPAVGLYTDSVKETIRRRMRDSFPRDAAGRVICGEASYAMTLRHNGSIDHLEVTPIRRYAEASSNLATYFVEPTMGYRNAGNATFSRPVATEEEELRLFAQRIAELLHGMAPFAAQPKLENVPAGQDGFQSLNPLVLVSGNIGVECRKWEVSP